MRFETDLAALAVMTDFSPQCHRFPHCLYFLRLLQHEEFREELRKVDFKRLLEDQQYWQCEAGASGAFPHVVL